MTRRELQKLANIATEFNKLSVIDIDNFLENTTTTEARNIAVASAFLGYNFSEGLDLSGLRISPEKIEAQLISYCDSAIPALIYCFKLDAVKNVVQKHYPTEGIAAAAENQNTKYLHRLIRMVKL